MTVEATQHHFSDGLYAKQMTLDKGHYAESHKHNYDHLSILAKGHVIVIADGVSTEYVAPACINIKKDVTHEIHALDDVIWYCIHATSETDITKIDEVLIKE